MEKFICYIFGLLIVLLFSIEYYKTARYSFSGIKKDDEFYTKLLEPQPPGKFTSRPYYLLSYFLFIIFSQIVFFSLTMTLRFFVPLVGLKESLPQESLILASALLTIGFLPNMPFLQNMISKTREIFHRAAKVPIHGRLIFDIMYEGELEYDQENIKKIMASGRYSMLGPDDFKKPDNDIQGIWAKIVYLRFIIKELDKDTSQKFSLKGNTDVWKQIDSEFSELVDSIKYYDSNTLNKGNNYNLYNQLRIFLYRLYSIISSGIVMVYQNHPGYAAILKKFGYTYSPPNIFSFNMKRLLFMAFSCAAGIIFGTIISSLISLSLSNMIPWLKEADIVKNLQQFLLYGIPFVIVPPLCVLLMKRFMSKNLDLWHTVNFENAYKRLSDHPWNIYLYIAFISYLVGVAVLMLLRIGFDKNTTLSMITNYNFIKSNMAWPIFSTIICVFVSIRSDIPYYSSGGLKIKNLIKETGPALVWGIITLIAVAVCFDLKRPEFLLLDLVSWDSISSEIKGRLFSYCIMGFFIGFLMSYTTRFKTIKEDRRRAPRFNTDIACRIKFGEFSTDVKFKNISVGGACVSIPDEIALVQGQDVVLSLNSEMQFKSRIRSIGRKMLSLSFLKDIEYDTINSIINLNKNRPLELKYAA